LSGAAQSPIALLLWVLPCVYGCRPDPPVCRFGREHVIFESTTTAFDDVAVAQLATHTLAVFSDATGLYARKLDMRGAPRSAVVRLGPRCNAGVSAAASGKEFTIACARGASNALAADGGVVAYTLDEQLQIARQQQFGRVGQHSHGVALALDAAGPVISWQDAALNGARIWLAGPVLAPSVLSEPSWDGAAPGLASRSGRLYATWSETRLAGKVVESRVRMLGLGSGAQAASPSTLVTTRDDAPSPELVATAAGSWLAFRDQRRLGRKKTGLYLLRLDSGGHALGAPVRAGRADGVGRPLLRACLGGLVTATPRTFAGDYFVGVVRADPQLRVLSGEQQFYEDSHEFAQVAAACVREHMLLLVAERGRLDAGSAALRSVTFSCD
jgi:hypothetical protein